MTVTVRDNTDRSRFEGYVDDSLAGFADYRLEGSTLELTHTEVGEDHQDEGLAGQLAEEAMRSARERGLEVVPTCGYMAGWLQKHPDHVDLVPEDRRAEFDL